MRPPLPVFAASATPASSTSSWVRQLGDAQCSPIGLPPTPPRPAAALLSLPPPAGAARPASGAWQPARAPCGRRQLAVVAAKKGGGGGGGKRRKPVRLLYSAGNHYDLLVK